MANESREPNDRSAIADGLDEAGQAALGVFKRRIVSHQAIHADVFLLGHGDVERLVGNSAFE